MSAFVTSRYTLSIGTAAALLAGCGGSQPTLGLPLQGFASHRSLDSQTYKILHEFGKTAGDGTNPYASLIVVKGTLYGTTLYGGSNNAGTVFSISKTGEETVLHSFGGPGDGAAPAAALLELNGMLYGTTVEGGANNSGSVFSITRAGKEKVLYSFPSSPNGGAQPYASLIAVNGTLYGTTYRGGDVSCGGGGCGSVFSITTSGTEKSLYSFGSRANDGEYPQAGLLDLDGTLYGTTTQGGKYQHGTVFTISSAGKESVLYSFGTNPGDGTNPSCALIYVKGALYGTTQHGPGNVYAGLVFSLTKFGRERIVYEFDKGEGSQPIAGLINVKGVLYGTTFVGGLKNVGTVFSVTTSGEQTVLHSFSAGSGESPYAGLVVADGTLYGTTYGASYQHHGNVYSIEP